MRLRDRNLIVASLIRFDRLANPCNKGGRPGWIELPTELKRLMAGRIIEHVVATKMNQHVVVVAFLDVLVAELIFTSQPMDVGLTLQCDSQSSRLRWVTNKPDLVNRGPQVRELSGRFQLRRRLRQPIGRERQQREKGNDAKRGGNEPLEVVL